MLAERWKRLRAAYDVVMDAPEAERQRLMDELSASDPELGSELNRLVAADPDGAAFLETPLLRLGPPRLEPGLVLSGRFTLVRLLGQGGMGEVWLARDRSLDIDVAVKMVRMAGDARPDLRRFTNEIQMARRISHPNVCRVYEFFEDAATTPPRAFLTMELLTGETLAARLKRSSALPAAEALVVFQQIARGLEAAHDAGVIHRDLKPANIMLLDGSSSRHAVVMDFGLARDHVRVESDGTTMPGTLVGTPEYMAPEQVTGGTVTPATDIYALGLILFEMLRGTRPFASSSTLDSWMRRAREGPEKLSGAVPGVQARVDWVIRKCLEYEPSRRPQRVAELLGALDSSLYIPVPRGRGFWATAAATVLAVAVAGSLYAWSRTRSALPPVEALQWYEEAQQALAEGASVRALNVVNRAITLAPEFAPAYAALAEIRLELDMPSAAQEAMLRANDLSRDRRGLPEPYVAYMDGIQALLQRHCDDAIAKLRSTAEAASLADKPFRMVTAARAMQRCDRPDDAQALMDAAARLDPRNAAVSVRRARLLASRRDVKGAFASLDVAEQLFRDRNNPEGVGEALTARGAIQAEQDMLTDAEVTLHEALGVAVGLKDVRQQIRVRLQQAIVHRKKGELDLAAAATTEAIELGRRANLETLTLEGLFAAGNVHMVRNQFDQARELFERALAIAETHRHEEYKARSNLSLASLLVQTLRPAEAVVPLEAGRRYYEGIGHSRIVASADAIRGQVRLAMMEYGQAIEQFSATATAARQAGDPEQEVRALENLATALAGAGQYTAALETYRTVTTMYTTAKRFRSEMFARISSADLLSRLGRLDEAAAAIAAVNVTDTSVHAQRTRVESAVLLRTGRHREALRVAGRARDLGADLSLERSLRTDMVMCVSAARLAQAGTAACDRLIGALPSLRHPAVHVESRLALAEAELSLGRREAAIAHLEAVRAILAPLGETEHQWRLFALLHAATPGDQAARERLTREIDNLRLKWGDVAYRTWQRRADVNLWLGSATNQNN